MAATEIILLERVDKLGAMGDVVRVRPGYARNFLLPQGKALRATAANKAYFEAQRTRLEAENTARREGATARAGVLEGILITLIRQAGERGQLYGSVAARDIVEGMADQLDQIITKGQVNLPTNIRSIGLFPVEIILHPEVRVSITVNIARTPTEAELQAKTGRVAVVVEEEKSASTPEEQDKGAAANSESV